MFVYDVVIVCSQDDNDDQYQSENSESDVIDSDFSIEENDELKSDAEDDDGPRRKKRLDTKAYRVIFKNVFGLYWLLTFC